jgi:hypothetical protein
VAGAVRDGGAGTGVAAAVVVGFAATGAEAELAGAAVLAVNQVFTPWWPRQAPLFEAAIEYVPSLHIP